MEEHVGVDHDSVGVLVNDRLDLLIVHVAAQQSATSPMQHRRRMSDLLHSFRQQNCQVTPLCLRGCTVGRREGGMDGWTNV